ncbi:MAG TPA: AtpZ/AtpI family protein [Longimicrobiales bacterium]|nr:AtpZ/AtpI family protein [Longimicrobiales bacterium]
MADPDRRGTQGTSGGEALGYALALVASTLLFLWLGSVADRWLSTEPLLTAIGALLGAGAGIYYMVRRLAGGDAGGAR